MKMKTNANLTWKWKMFHFVSGLQKFVGMEIDFNTRVLTILQ